MGAIDIDVSVESVYKKGFEDINFFASLVLPPDIFEHAFPEYYTNIHLLLLKALLERNEVDADRVLRLALGLPRGFAKTTFLKVLTIWLLCYDFVTFIIIVCATEPLAENFLADLDDMLGEEQVQKIYGRWTSVKAIDNKAKKTAMFRNRPVILIAIGANTSTRGINLKHRRPDAVLCDDMQTEANDRSETEREVLFDWFIGTLLKLVAPKFAIVIYLGNMYSEFCILYRLKNNPFWISLVTGCILADKKSLWEEVHPLKVLYNSYKHDESLGRAGIWFAEMMNDPASARQSLLPAGALPPCMFEEHELVPDYGFLTIDPANFEDSSDDNVIAAHYVIGETPIVVDMVADKLNPEQIILESFRLCIAHNIRVIGVETVAFQKSLMFWFNKYLLKFNLQHLQVVELQPRGRSKEQRIRTWVMLALASKYQIYGHDLRAKIVWQAVQYKFGKKKNKDDILDACAYGDDMINLHWDVITSVQLKQIQVIDARVVTNNTPF